MVATPRGMQTNAHRYPYRLAMAIAVIVGTAILICSGVTQAETTITLKAAFISVAVPGVVVGGPLEIVGTVNDVTGIGEADFDATMNLWLPPWPLPLSFIIEKDNIPIVYNKTTGTLTLGVGSIIAPTPDGLLTFDGTLDFQTTWGVMWWSGLLTVTVPTYFWPHIGPYTFPAAIWAGVVTYFDTVGEVTSLSEVISPSSESCYNNDSYKFMVAYRNTAGNSPDRVVVVVDGKSTVMDRYGGSPNLPAGEIYRAYVPITRAGDHNYYYFAQRGGTRTARLPETDWLSFEGCCCDVPVCEQVTATPRALEATEDRGSEFTLAAHPEDDASLLFEVSSNPLHGTISNFNETTGEGIYTPDPNYSGQDSFTFLASIGCNRSAEDRGTVSITVIDVNDAPVAKDAILTPDVLEDSYADISMRNSLYASDVDNTVDELSFSIISDPRNGTLVEMANEVYKYTPNKNFKGSDSFRFRCEDPGGLSSRNEATLTINVADEVGGAGNDPPNAVSEPVSVAQNTPKTIYLHGSDPEQQPITFSISDDPDHGTITGPNPTTGTLMYTPDSGFLGSDHFDFTVSDGAKTATATISISVTLTILPAPTATSSSYSTDEDVSLAIQLEGSKPGLTFQIVDIPSHGDLTGTAPNVTYAPHLNYSGNDSFTFTVNDGTDTSEQGMISLRIDAVPDAPTATGRKLSIQKNTDVQISLSASDPDSASLTYSISMDPSHGSISGSYTSTGILTYTPASVYRGDDSFTFRATDGNGLFDTADVEIKVGVANAPPVVEFIPSSGTLQAGRAVGFDGSGSHDPEGDAIVSYEWTYGDGGTATGVLSSHVYVSAGSYNVSLEVTDEWGGSGSFERTIVVVPMTNPEPADAWFSFLPPAPRSGEQVSFNAQQSRGSSGSVIVSYEWNLGDGASSMGRIATHAYEKSGWYSVELTVRDSLGKLATRTRNVFVAVAPDTPDDPEPPTPPDGVVKAPENLVAQWNADGTVSLSWEVRSPLSGWTLIQRKELAQSDSAFATIDTPFFCLAYRDCSPDLLFENIYEYRVRHFASARHFSAAARSSSSTYSLFTVTKQDPDYLTLLLAQADLAPKSAVAILPHNRFAGGCSALKTSVQNYLDILQAQRSLSGIEWLDDGLGWFAETVTSGMHDAVLGIAGLFWEIKPTGHDLRTARDLITASVTREVSLDLGRSLSEEERTAISRAIEEALDPMVEREGDSLDSIMHYMRSSETSLTGSEKMRKLSTDFGSSIISAGALVWWLNWGNIQTAFYGAVIMQQAGVIGGAKAAIISGARDVGIAKVGSFALYASPLVVALAVNEVAGTGASSSLVIAGRAKLEEAGQITDSLSRVPSTSYSYEHIARLYEGWLLLRDAAELFSRAYAALTIKNDNIVEKMEQWRRLVDSHDSDSWLLELDTLLVEVAIAAYKTSGWKNMSIPLTWQLSHDAAIIEALEQEAGM